MFAFRALIAASSAHKTFAGRRKEEFSSHRSRVGAARVLRPINQD
jgi:hypothetical protein